MRHVLFFTDTPLYGGAENQMYLLAKFLDRENYRVLFVCLASSMLNELQARLQQSHIEVVRLPYEHKHDPRISTALERLIKGHPIDLIHLHLWNPASCRYGFLVARSLDIPVVVTEHDPFKLSRLKTVFKKLLTKNIKAVIGISRAGIEFLKDEYPGTPLDLIANGIDIEAWEHRIQKVNRSYMRDFLKAGDRKIILSVGALHPRKGHDLLIDAFARMVRRDGGAERGAGHDDARVGEMRPLLVIVGSGPEEERLKSLVDRYELGDLVRFMGQRFDVADFFAAADLFVYPSRREALGMAILEAGLAKVPVVASAIGGIPDMVEDNATGLLVPVEDPEKLALAMEKMLKDEKFMNRMAENLHTKVKSRFSAEMMAKKTQELYDRILKAEVTEQSHESKKRLSV